MHHDSWPQPLPRRDFRAFTLVELTIVILMIAILAALVIPKFTSAAEASRESALKSDLHVIRRQIQLYKAQHAGLPTLDQFEAQMTGFTDTDGNVLAAKTGSSLGPYLRELPKNPYTDTSDVSDQPVGSSAWYYDPDTGEFYANDSADTRAY